jgi:hypothetical protein
MALRLIGIVALITLFHVCIGASAADGLTQDQETRRFDVHGLLLQTPDLVLDMREGDVRTQPAASPEAMAERLLEQIRAALTDAETPAKLEVQEGTLVATGTSRQLTALEELVVQFNRSRNLQLNLELRVLVLKADALDALPKDMRRSIAAARSAPQLGGEDVLRVLMGHREEGIESLTAPNVTIFNQQRASAQVETTHGFNRDVVRDPEGGWKAEIGSTWSGLRVTFRGGISADGKEASAEMHVVCQRLHGFSEVPVQGTELVRQVPIVEKLEVNRVAVGADRNILLYAGPKQVVGGPRDGEMTDDLMLILVRLKPLAVREFDTSGKER